jgi:hypothetical protein
VKHSTQGCTLALENALAPTSGGGSAHFWEERQTAGGGGGQVANTSRGRARDGRRVKVGMNHRWVLRTSWLVSCG